MGLFSVCHDVLKALVNLVRHRNKPHTTFGLGLLHMVDPTFFLHELLFNPDFPVLKVKIAKGESAEFADPHSGSQQNNELIIVAAVVGVLFYKGHEDILFLWV